MTIASHFVGLTGGLLMSMIAFSIVFIVILGLMGMMMALKVFAGAVDNAQKAKEASVAAPAATPRPTAVAAPAASAVVATDEDEVLAAISAAIAVVCGARARVVSFAQVPVASGGAWRMTGRLQNSEGFLD